MVDLGVVMKVTIKKHLFCLLTIMFGLTNVLAERNAMVESAEALLAVIKQQESMGSRDSRDHDVYDWDDAKNISQTVYVEREVQRDVFTSVLVETEREAFTKKAEQAIELLKKWIEVEKALVDNKSDVSATASTDKSTSSFSSSSAMPSPSIPSSLPAPNDSKPFSFLSSNKTEDKKTDASSSADKPLSFLERFKKDREKEAETKKDDLPASSNTPITPPAILLGTTSSSVSTSSAPAVPLMSSAAMPVPNVPGSVTSSPASIVPSATTATPAIPSAETSLPATPSTGSAVAVPDVAKDKPAAEADKGDEGKNPLEILRSKRLKALGQK
jgi:hypothetical protein